MLPLPEGASELAGIIDNSVKLRVIAPHERVKTIAVILPSGLGSVRITSFPQGEVHPDVPDSKAATNRVAIPASSLWSLTVALDSLAIVKSLLDQGSVSCRVTIRPLKDKDALIGCPKVKLVGTSHILGLIVA